MCRDCVSWFVSRVCFPLPLIGSRELSWMKGSILDENQPIEYEFYRVIPLNSSLLLEDEIFESFADVDPEYSTGIQVPLSHFLRR
jgi:hypothetical protein